MKWVIATDFERFQVVAQTQKVRIVRRRGIAGTEVNNTINNFAGKSKE